MCSAFSVAFDAAARRDPLVKVNWIFAMDGRRFDFAVAGSSRAYHTVDVPTVERAVGGTGVNVGMNSAAFFEMALVLDRFLAHNQARDVLLEVDPFGLDHRWLDDELHAHWYLPYMDEPLVAGYLTEYFGPRALFWHYVPEFKYAEYNDRIGLSSVLHLISHPPPEFDEWGGRLSNGRMTDSMVRTIRDTVYEINANRVRGLLRVLDVAAAHKARVTMFMAPQFTPAAHAVRDREAVIAFIRALAAQRGIAFLVFDDPDIAGDAANFGDPGHLNREGAMKFSRRLGCALRTQWGVGRLPEAPAGSTLCERK